MTMLKEETILLIPTKWSPPIVPDWKRCEALEETNGYVDMRMLMRELNVTTEKARKVLMRWESMKNAREMQKRLGDRE
jgi:hypothetical protein